MLNITVKTMQLGQIEMLVYGLIIFQYFLVNRALSVPSFSRNQPHSRLWRHFWATYSSLLNSRTGTIFHCQRQFHKKTNNGGYAAAFCLAYPHAEFRVENSLFCTCVMVNVNIKTAPQLKANILNIQPKDRGLELFLDVNKQCEKRMEMVN